MYDEQKIEAACRKYKCRFEWETDEDIEVTLPRGKTWTNGVKHKIFNIECEPVDFIIDYIRDHATA